MAKEQILGCAADDQPGRSDRPGDGWGLDWAGKRSKAGMSSPSLTFWGLCFETQGHLRWELMTNGPVSPFEARNFSGRGGPSRVHGAPSGGEVPVSGNPKRVTLLFSFEPPMHRKTRQNHASGMQLNVHFFSGRCLFDMSPASGLPDLESPPNGQMMLSSGLPKRDSHPVVQPLRASQVEIQGLACS